MDFIQNHTTSLFDLKAGNFAAAAISMFQYQAKGNKVYRNLLQHLNVNPQEIDTPDQIPFLPIELFRQHQVITGNPSIAKVFESSGTTDSITSRHCVADLRLYEKSLLHCFHRFYGDPSRYIFLALLPSYLERGNSSLVYMANILIRQSGHSSSGFFKDDIERLVTVIEQEKDSSSKIFLLGVSFALLDLADRYHLDLNGAIVMETGGMKGRGREMIREELHQHLKDKTNAKVIHSEYGMTELLSQAYSQEDGRFRCPPWMEVFIGDPYDPFALLPAGETGIIKVIDLANIHSCSFIATSDIGKRHQDGSFEVLGRLDHSDIRGCNLMML